MDKEETAAPFPEGEKGGGDRGVGERGGEQFQKSEHTHLKRTSCEKKWTDRKTFYIRLNSQRNDQNNEVKDNSVKKDLELKFNIWLFCC